MELDFDARRAKCGSFGEVVMRDANPAFVTYIRPCVFHAPIDLKQVVVYNSTDILDRLTKCDRLLPEARRSSKTRVYGLRILLKSHSLGIFGVDGLYAF